LALVALVALGAPAAAAAKSRTAAALTQNGPTMPQVGVKTTWLFHRFPAKRSSPAFWIITGAHSHFGAKPLLEPIGSSGLALHWTGWMTYPDGEYEHDHGGIRWRSFERVGTWQYIVRGQCEATIYLRLRITVRPPKIVGGHVRPARATTLATMNYGEYAPKVAVIVPVKLRYLN
jgi:hypothetical protein